MPTGWGREGRGVEKLCAARSLSHLDEFAMLPAVPLVSGSYGFSSKRESMIHQDQVAKFSDKRWFCLSISGFERDDQGYGMKMNWIALHFCESSQS